MNQMTALKNTFHTYLDTDKHDIGLDTNLSSSFIWHSNLWHPLPVSSPSSPNLSSLLCKTSFPSSLPPFLNSLSSPYRDRQLFSFIVFYKE